MRGPRETSHVGTLKRIMVSNIVSYDSTGSIGNIISGVPDYPITDVKISNFYMEHTGGIGAEQARNPAAGRNQQVPRPRDVRTDARELAIN